MIMRKWMIFRFGLSVLVAKKRSGVDGPPGTSSKSFKSDKTCNVTTVTTDTD